MWYWHQDTLTDQWNRTEPRNRCTHLLTTDFQQRYKGNSVKKQKNIFVRRFPKPRVTRHNTNSIIHKRTNGKVGLY